MMIAKTRASALRLSGGSVGRAVLRDELGEHLAAVPDAVLAHVVDALHAPRPARLGVAERDVEHVERELPAAQEEAAQGGQAHGQ